MYNGLANQAIPSTDCISTSARRVTYKEELEATVKYHEEALDKARRMQKLLADNPAILEFMELSR